MATSGLVGSTEQRLREMNAQLLVSSIHQHELTEQAQKAESALRRSEERRRLALDAAELGAWNINPSLKKLETDERFRAIVGVTKESLDFEEAFASVHPDDQDSVRDAMIAAASNDNGGSYEIECRVLHPDGSIHWVCAKGRANCEREGTSKTVVSFDGTLADVTERKRVEEDLARLAKSDRASRIEAERAGQMKDEFLATLSHEIRTPLSAILGWAQILRRSVDKPAVLAEGLETIERNARVQAQLIDDLLDMSRIISGKVGLAPEWINLVTVIRAAIETIRASALAKGIEIIFDEPIDARYPVLGDINRLQQVFWNLLSNAIKFTPQGGVVTVRLNVKASRWQVDVIDTGEGISAEFVPHVFDRFRQADASTTRTHGGLGLGLAIVKQLVELHGGVVGVFSAGRGAGSTFTVTLPISALQSVAALPAANARRNGEQPMPELAHPVSKAISWDNSTRELQDIRVVVVDDEADARSMLKRLLEDCGATVLLAAHAADAIEIIQRERPQVIVSDIGMPDEDGYSLIRRVRKLGAASGGSTPAVALTAYARAEDRVKAVRAGFQLHVPKPVEPAELIAMVASLVTPSHV